LRENLKQYGNNYALTDSILHIGCDIAKNQLFESADVNVKYAEAVAARMRALGHELKLIFATRREVLTAVCDNIHSWISLSGDLAFSHQHGIYGFKFPKRFLEISSRDLTLL
jgi:hypothetical protein